MGDTARKNSVPSPPETAAKIENGHPPHSARANQRPERFRRDAWENLMKWLRRPNIDHDLFAPAKHSATSVTDAHFVTQWTIRTEYQQPDPALLNCGNRFVLPRHPVRSPREATERCRRQRQRARSGPSSRSSTPPRAIKRRGSIPSGASSSTRPLGNGVCRMR